MTTENKPKMIYLFNCTKNGFCDGFKGWGNCIKDGKVCKYLEVKCYEIED
jgi:hypothetical protein